MSASTANPAPLATPEAVLHFWFGDGLTRDWPSDDRNPLWFGGGPALDARITERFGPSVAQALAGGLTDWEGPLDHRLALVLLLDQFSRNVHRGQAAAFAGDGRAQRLVLQTLALADAESLPTVGRVFLYMPLMHAESVALQHECVSRFQALAQHSPPELAQRLQGNLQAARQHLEIIERFGRFPHRNAVLGRTSTPAEAAFLTDGPRFGQ
jgi:uncharacterized protein (DUF924 family)